MACKRFVGSIPIASTTTTTTDDDDRRRRTSETSDRPTDCRRSTDRLLPDW
jgi:hypothetical protein